MDQVPSLPSTPAPRQWQWAGSPGTGPWEPKGRAECSPLLDLAGGSHPQQPGSGEGEGVWPGPPLPCPLRGQPRLAKHGGDRTQHQHLCRKGDNLARGLLREGGGVGGSAGESPRNRPLQEETFTVTLRNNSTRWALPWILSLSGHEMEQAPPSLPSCRQRHRRGVTRPGHTTSGVQQRPIHPRAPRCVINRRSLRRWGVPLGALG